MTKNKSDHNSVFFDHPCKRICSGWKQGYEVGKESRESKITALKEKLIHYETDSLHTCHENCKRSMCVLTRDNAALNSRVVKLKEALFKIGNYDTLDGEKYNSYGQGWEGVAVFARQALAEDEK